MIVLGIDPGCGHTGWAVVDVKRRLIVDIGTLRDKAAGETCEQIAYIAAIRYPHFIAVQNPISDGRVPRFYKGDKSGIALAKNVELSALILGYLQGQGRPVVSVKPLRGTGNKMKRKDWQLYWQWTGRTSQDARDAAQIALQAVKEGRT